MSETAAAVRKMITFKQVLELIGVARSTLYAWMEAGTFPRPVNIGDQATRFYEDEVIAWQKAREAQSAKTAPPRGPLKPIKPRVGFRPPIRAPK